MVRRRGTNINLDEVLEMLVGLFQIPTKQDVVDLVRRIDAVERAIDQLSRNIIKESTDDQVTTRLRKGAKVGITAQVVTSLSAHPNGARPKDVANETCLPIRTVYYGINKAVKDGLVEKKDKGIYRLI
ncbi:MAG: hypothetical protein HQK57_10650 [Deltaproteobacteria bacterium]|nr:hypothetical protein [Deltaproteobacteria bacterium]MBF0509369.1 hypothetical protein [Deltaproteobacteria bacterium]